jgi:hypothetical protein
MRNKVDAVKWLCERIPNYITHYDKHGNFDERYMDMECVLRDVPYSKYEHHTILKRDATPNAECMVCDEEENVYVLPCSKSNSIHSICGECIYKLLIHGKLKCPYCRKNVYFNRIVRSATSDEQHEMKK